MRDVFSQFADAYDDQIWNELLFGVRKEAEERDREDTEALDDWEQQEDTRPDPDVRA